MKKNFENKSNSTAIKNSTRIYLINFSFLIFFIFLRYLAFNVVKDGFVIVYVISWLMLLAAYLCFFMTGAKNKIIKLLVLLAFIICISQTDFLLNTKAHDKIKFFFKVNQYEKLISENNNNVRTLFYIHKDWIEDSNFTAYIYDPTDKPLLFHDKYAGHPHTCKMLKQHWYLCGFGVH